MSTSIRPFTPNTEGTSNMSTYPEPTGRCLNPQPCPGACSFTGGEHTHGCDYATASEIECHACLSAFNTDPGDGPQETETDPGPVVEFHAGEVSGHGCAACIDLYECECPYPDDADEVE